MLLPVIETMQSSILRFTRKRRPAELDFEEADPSAEKSSSDDEHYQGFNVSPARIVGEAERKFKRYKRHQEHGTRKRLKRGIAQSGDSSSSFSLDSEEEESSDRHLYLAPKRSGTSTVPIGGAIRDSSSEFESYFTDEDGEDAAEALVRLRETTGEVLYWESFPSALEILRNDGWATFYTTNWGKGYFRSIEHVLDSVGTSNNTRARTQSKQLFSWLTERRVHFEHHKLKFTGLTQPCYMCNSQRQVYVSIHVDGVLIGYLAKTCYARTTAIACVVTKLFNASTLVAPDERTLRELRKELTDLKNQVELTQILANDGFVEEATLLRSFF